MTDKYVLVETETIDFSAMKTEFNDRIAGFFGEYRWLSNFWDCDVEFKGITFPSVEHAYVYSKGTFSEDEFDELLLSSAGEAKRIGKKIKLRPGFEETKVSIMKHLVYQKFKNPDLQAKLLETGSRSILEVNTWNDRFWGVDTEGNGLNMLGKILEEVREYYKRQALSHEV